MTEGATTAALVVGIDRYDIGPALLRPLSGAVADAAAAVGWLKTLDVPNDRIFLHSSPLDAPAAVATGVAVRPAGERDIWSSAYEIGTLSGSRLFIFLFGHAVFEPRYKRLFFTQEFGVNDNWANLSIDRYIDYFLSRDFRRQFLFLDGCHNLPYPEKARGRFRAGFLGGEDITPRAENSMVACFSCSQSEVAQEIGGRGLFTQHLLEAVAPTAPLPDALLLDWRTGERSVDIRLVMEALAPLVSQEAATAPGGQLQHPDYRLEGWPTDRSTIMRLPGDGVGLDIEVDPATDVGTGLRLVEVQGESPPYWTRRWAEPPAVKLPKGLPTRVVCWVQNGWRCRPEQVRLSIDSDQSVRFLLDRDVRPGMPETWVPPEPGTVEIHRLFAHQLGTGDWYETPYKEAASTLGKPAPPAGRAVVAPGITMFEHESGPEFHVGGDARRRADAVVGDWWRALENVTPIDVSYRLEIIETVPAPAEPELRLELPPGGADRLAGPLAGHRVVRVGAAGAAPSEETLRSLQEVEREPLIKARPGPVRVAVELPWGSWSQVVNLGEREQATVALPAEVGLPPLRITLAGELEWAPIGTRAPTGTRVIGVSGSRPTGWVQTGLFGPSQGRLRAARRGSAAWSLAVPPSLDYADAYAGPMPLVALESGVRFPVIWGRAFGMEATRRVLRVEPLSPVPTPQWDLLVTTGRLDSLGEEERNELAHGKWQDPLLGVAAAYAIHVAGDRRTLEVVLTNTQGLFEGTRLCDLDLLDIAAIHPEAGRLDAADVDRLELLARQGAVPGFRWGVDLALDLVVRARTTPVLDAWAAALARIKKRSSRLSIWTAWRDARTRRNASAGRRNRNTKVGS